jgi:hypothetical protein
MAKFIQVNQWDRKYEKADKIVVNTEQIVQVNPAATDHRAIILTVRGEFTVDHTVEELASMLLAKELKCWSIGTPASYARTRFQRKISASVAGFQQSMRCGGQPPAELGAGSVILVWTDRRRCEIHDSPAEKRNGEAQY